jgi:hypothetical protein
MQYGIAFANVRKKLVPEAFTMACSADESGYVHDVHRCRNGALRLAYFAKHIQTAVGHVGAAEIWLYGAEREIGGLRLTGTYTIEKGGFAYVGQPHDTAFEAHIILFNSQRYHSFFCFCRILKNIFRFLKK